MLLENIRENVVRNMNLMEDVHKNKRSNVSRLTSLSVFPPMGDSNNQLFPWLATILDHIQDAIITVDILEKVTFMSPSAEKLFACRREKALCRNIREIFTMVDKQAGSLIPLPVTESIRQNKVIPLKPSVLILNHAHVRHNVEGWVMPMTNEYGQIVGATLIVHSVIIN
ncbi:MAG: hypothetical protein HQM11_16520 [SAR324 cluster bacterium]|nr:hypothetical protein [SAR324 cluster bacterium]